MNLRFGITPAQSPVWIGVALLVLIALVLFLRWADRKRRDRLARFVETGLASRLLEGYDERLLRPLAWLTVLGAAALLLAFAQPHWGRSWVNVSRTSRDVLILLDTSESMNAQNPLPTRLERAKMKIQSLLDLCPGDRFGLIAFSGDAVMQVPLTLDRNYFRSVLDAMNTDTLTVEGTDIGAALAEAGRVFEEDAQKTGDAGKNSRVILLITDGEQTSGDEIKAAADMKDFAGLYVLGIGDPKGATISYPVLLQRYARAKVPENEKHHLSRLDEDGLSTLAKANGGAYVRISPDNSDVKFIHDELEQVQSRSMAEDVRFNLVNRYRWPLSLAIFCFMAEGIWLVMLPWIRRIKLNRAGSAGHA